MQLQQRVAVAQSNWHCPDLTGGTSERWGYHALPVIAETNNEVQIVCTATEVSATEL